jgi:hypothetical protein
MREISTEQLEGILSEHQLWLNSNGGKGERADLREADLTWVDLEGADLREADLRGTNLLGAHLEGVDLRGVDLTFKLISFCKRVVSHANHAF